MDFLEEEQVRALIQDGTTSMCLFASYSDMPHIFDNHIEYVRQLATHFDRVLFLTNLRGAGAHVTNADRLPSTCEIVYLPNQGNDFGMWYRILHRLPKERLQKLGLVNDSCYIVNDLANAFARAKRNGLEFWGLLKSEEVSPHIQSFFIVMDGENAINHALTFFHDQVMPAQIDRHHLIYEWEVGFSQHMATRFPIAGLYSMQDVLRICPKRDLPDNASVNYWDVLLHMRYPLLKRTRCMVSGAHQLMSDLIDPYFWKTLLGMPDRMF